MQGDGNHLADSDIAARHQHDNCMFVLASESDNGGLSRVDGSIVEKQASKS